MIVDEMESAMRESIVGNWGVGLLVTLAGFWVVLVFLGLRLTRFRWRVAAALALIVSSSMYLGLHPEWQVDGGWLGKLARDGLAVPMASSMVLPAIKVVLFVVSALALLVATDWLPLKLFVSQAGTLELDDPGDAVAGDLRRTGARVRAGGPGSRGSGEPAAARPSRTRAVRPADPPREGPGSAPEESDFVSREERHTSGPFSGAEAADEIAGGQLERDDSGTEDAGDLVVSTQPWVSSAPEATSAPAAPENFGETHFLPSDEPSEELSPDEGPSAAVHPGPESDSGAIGAGRTEDGDTSQRDAEATSVNSQLVEAVLDENREAVEVEPSVEAATSPWERFRHPLGEAPVEEREDAPVAEGVPFAGSWKQLPGLQAGIEAMSAHQDRSSGAVLDDDEVAAEAVVTEELLEAAAPGHEEPVLLGDDDDDDWEEEDEDEDWEDDDEDDEEEEEEEEEEDEEDYEDDEDEDWEEEEEEEEEEEDEDYEYEDEDGEEEEEEEGEDFEDRRSGDGMASGTAATSPEPSSPVDVAEEPAAVQERGPVLSDLDAVVAGVPAEEREAFLRAVGVLVGLETISLSRLQREIGVTYYMAARIFERLERAGMITSYAGSLARDVVLDRDAWQEWFAQRV